MSAATGAAPEILFVCTGNLCRSPYMEYTLRAMLATKGVQHVSIGSAGTRALRGRAMAAPVAQRLRDRGEDPSRFRASALRREEVDAAALVVTACRDHRREVVRLQHDAAERTFTLAQLARLLMASPVGVPSPVSVPDLVSAAHAARGRTPAAAAAGDDLEDPWGRSRRTYRRVADRIDALLIPVADRLAGRG